EIYEARPTRSPGPTGTNWCTLRPQPQQRPLMLQQPTFAVEATAVTGQLPPRSDHPVTGNDDRNRVLAVGRAHGAAGADLAELARQRAVAHRRPVGNGAQGNPDAPLERRAGRVEWQVEGGSAAGE